MMVFHAKTTSLNAHFLNFKMGWPDAYFSINSSVVLWDLILSSPGTFLKWITLTAVLMILEIFPLLLKIYSGRTDIGLSISQSRHQGYAKYIKKIDSIDKNLEEALVRSSAQLDGIKLAFEDSTQEYADYAKQALRPLGPIDAFKKLVNELEETTLNREEFIRRFPEFASLYDKAFGSAIDKAVSLVN